MDHPAFSPVFAFPTQLPFVASPPFLQMLQMINCNTQAALDQPESEAHPQTSANEDRIEIVALFPRLITRTPSSSTQSSPSSSSVSPASQRSSTGHKDKPCSPPAACHCPICGKAFSRHWLLQGHIRTHTGERPFECSTCHKKFADKSNLRAHVQTHSGLKPFECSHCHRRFALKSYLSKHEESSCKKLRHLVI